MVGVTAFVFPVPKALLHVYVNPPFALIVAVAPLHIVAPLVFTISVGFTTTTHDAVPMHPFPSVPVTLYVVVAVGDTVFGLPAPKPLLQLYVFAPFALMLILEPIHIVPPVAVTFGNGFTVTTHDDVLLHKFASVPVTIYVVVVIGFTVFGLPAPKPFHVYVIPPPAVIFIEFPKHIAPPVAVIVGNGFTFTTTLPVPVQPNVLMPVT